MLPNRAGLTDQQQIAVDRINSFILNPVKRFFTLQGCAGTGKTHVISAIALHPINSKRIAVTAPSNNAVTVVKNKMKSLSLDIEKFVSFMTLHRHLGLKMDTVEDYQLLVYKDESEAVHYDIVFIDECSMVGEKLFNIIRFKNKKTKYIFVGDPAQLEPVGEGISPCFRSVSDVFKLDEVIRFSNRNPLSILVNEVRKISETDGLSLSDISSYLKSSYTNDMRVGLWCYEYDKRDIWYDQILRAFSSIKSDNNCNFARIITWRNSTERIINQYVRNRLLNTNDSFTPGEIIFTKDAVIKEGSVVLSTSSELSILDVKENDIVTRFNYDFLPTISLPGYKLKVEQLNNEIIDINVVHPQYLTKWGDYKKEVARKVKHFGKSDNSYFIWKEYWDVFGAIPEVSYRYALTVRRSQGMTINNVFPCYADLISSPENENKIRNLYVALSRASERIIMLV